jgi:hypothetical protein
VWARSPSVRGVVTDGSVAPSTISGRQIRFSLRHVVSCTNGSSHHQENPVSPGPVCATVTESNEATNALACGWTSWIATRGGCASAGWATASATASRSALVRLGIVEGTGRGIDTPCVVSVLESVNWILRFAAPFTLSEGRHRTPTG